MSSIKDGIINGVVPEKNMFAVLYPGYPSSLDRAVETLGGPQAMAKARSSESNYLELRYRPEDPFSHPVFGELRALSGIVLGFSKGGRDDDEIHAEIVAKVDQCYEFNGMADYQYVAPIHVKLEKGKKRQRLQSLHGEHGLTMDMDQEAIMLLPPPLFSVKDMPEELVLQPSEVSRALHRQALLTQAPWQPQDPQVEIVPCFNLDFKIKEIPPKIDWENRIDKNTSDWHIMSTLTKLFEERPIWAKSTINDRLIESGICITDVQLRRLLFRLSYYFAYGPFRTLWIRNGYDPRKDPESRIFQMVDFRVPKSVRKEAHAHLLEKGEAAASITWSDICHFKEAPLKKFSYLQLYDLDDEYIRSQIQKPAEQATCNEYTGWFSRATIIRIRHHIRVRFLRLIPGNMAQQLEQVESKRLNTLKQMDLISSIPKSKANGLMQEGELGDASVSSGVDSQNLNFNDNEEDDEEDEEEEEEEEEVYRPLEELTFQNNTDNYMDSIENIPKNYLQELLVKFPFSTGENIESTRNIDLSDEETSYAILEQDDEDDD